MRPLDLVKMAVIIIIIIVKIQYLKGIYSKDMFRHVLCAHVILPIELITRVILVYR